VCVYVRDRVHFRKRAQIVICVCMSQCVCVLCVCACARVCVCVFAYFYTHMKKNETEQTCERSNSRLRFTHFTIIHVVFRIMVRYNGSHSLPHYCTSGLVFTHSYTHALKCIMFRSSPFSLSLSIFMCITIYIYISIIDLRTCLDLEKMNLKDLLNYTKCVYHCACVPCNIYINICVHTQYYKPA